MSGSLDMDQNYLFISRRHARVKNTPLHPTFIQ